MKDRNPHMELSAYDTYNALSEQDRNKIAEKAMGLFVNASMKFPATVTGQSALVARHCKEQKINQPLVLMQCLIMDTPKVTKLTEMAVQAHGRADKGPFVLYRDDVIRIVDGVFSYANYFMHFSYVDLDFIMNELRQKAVTDQIDELGYYLLALDVKNQRKMWGKDGKKAGIQLVNLHPKNFKGK